VIGSGPARRGPHRWWRGRGRRAPSTAFPGCNRLQRLHAHGHAEDGADAVLADRCSTGAATRSPRRCRGCSPGCRARRCPRRVPGASRTARAPIRVAGRRFVVMDIVQSSQARPDRRQPLLLRSPLSVGGTRCRDGAAGYGSNPWR
jgi:hypothetical protein